MSRTRTVFSALVVLLLASLFAACGTSDEPAAGDDSGGNTADSSPGDEETTPRVIALEWMQAEALVTLGVMPVGVADVEGYNTWVSAAAPLDDTVADVGTRGEPSIDAVIDLEPDLIVVEASTSPDVISQLENYAEVLVITGSDASNNLEHMRSNLTTIAAAVGAEDEAERLLAEFDTFLADAATELEAAGVAGQGFAMADGWMDGSTVSIRMFAQGSLMSDLAEAVGLENRWTESGDEAWGLGVTDVEGLTALTDDDIHFFYSASDAEYDVFGGALASNPIWAGLPFVESEQINKLTPGTWTFGNVAAAKFFVEQIVAALAP